MFIRASSRGCTAGSSGTGTHAPAPRSTVVPGLGHSFFLHPFSPLASVQSSRCTWLSPGLPGNRSEVAHRVKLCSRSIILSLVQTQSTHPDPREPGLRCWTRDSRRGGHWRGTAAHYRHQMGAPAVNSLLSPSLLGCKYREEDNSQQGKAARHRGVCPQWCYSQAGRLAGEERNLNYTSYEAVWVFPTVIAVWVSAGFPTSRADPGGNEGHREKAGLECDSLAYLKCYLLSSKPIL